MYQRIKNWLMNFNITSNKKKYLFFNAVILGVIIQLLTFLLIDLGVNQENFTNDTIASTETVGEALLISLILAPILETLICQFVTYKFIQFILVKFKRNNITEYIIPFVISVLAFAGQHYYSIYYVLIMLIPATAFQYTFVKVFSETQKYRKAYLLTATQHFIYNFSTLLTSIVFAILGFI